MTVEEQRTMQFIQSACESYVSRYTDCKLKIFCVNTYSSTQKYEDAINEFMSNHNVVDVKVTQSDVSYFAYIFYKG